MSAEYIRRLESAYGSFRQKTDFEPEVLIVLGSGQGDLADGMRVVFRLDFSEIDGMPVSTVDGHKGRYLFGYIGETKVAVMQGRLHYYEGYTPQECVMPIRLMAMCGVKAMLFTNAAGGITCPEVGTLMRITDHISLVPSPLRGENYPRLGKRFPDMTGMYDARLGKLIDGIAEKNGTQLKRGVYIQFQGPAIETAAEIRMAKIIGADAVGMSSAIDALAARHAGMKVAGISCIVNPACGIEDVSLDDIDESEAMSRSGEDLKKILFETAERIKEIF